MAEAGATNRPEFVVGTADGWAVDDKGVPTPMTTEQRQRYVASWSRNIYVMYHRLAREDRALSVKLVGDREFAVNEAGEEVGRFQLDARGHLVRWSAAAPLNGRDEDWIYGPHRDFGDLSFPDWGTRRDGTYRFYYTQVKLSPRSPDEQIFTLSWHGNGCGDH